MRPRTSKAMCLRSILPLLALCGLLAACGSSSTHPTAAATHTHTVTRTVPDTTTASSTPTTSSNPTTPTTSTTATTNAASAGGQCVAADLAGSFLGGDGATGHDKLAFALRNTSGHSCRTGGYPGVLFLDAAGHPLPTHPMHTTDSYFGHTTLRELTVAPGATVSFYIGVTDMGQGGSQTGCQRASALQVIAPNDTATLRVSVHGGLYECGGSATVSPMLPGTTASQ